jgi:ketosteroid isomerase-like protein
MSDEDVAFVRRGFEVVARAFDAYWRDPRSITQAMETDELWPEWRELFDLLDPAVEWKTLFLGTTFHGRDGVANGWDDFLTWADHYRPGLEDAEDLGENGVLIMGAFAGTAKDGPPMTGGFFAIFTVGDGRIVSVHEHTTRAEALAALEQQGG